MLECAPACVVVLMVGGFEDLELDLGGLVRVTHASGAFSESLGADQALRLSGVSVRGTAWCGLTSEWSMELHLTQQIVGRAALLNLNGGGALAAGDGFIFGETHRSAALRWVQLEEPTALAVAAIDRLWVRYEIERLRVTVGRQPISWATNALFVPNDFFQPFVAQTFFRLYKPGVDAALVEWSFGTFTRVELVGVLGYRRTGAPSAGDPPDLGRSALLVRGGTVLADLDWTLLGGRSREGWVFGGAVQGELFSWLGVGLEGHALAPSTGSDLVGRLSLAMHRRFDPGLALRIEHLIQTDGARTPLDRAIAFAAPSGQGLVGPHLSGFAVSYELHPLVDVRVTTLYAWTDRSVAIALNAAVSLLDEAELALSGFLPFGAGLTADGLPGSELGIYPWSITGEARIYY